MNQTIRFFNTQHDIDPGLYSHIWVNLSYEIESHILFYQKNESTTQIEVENCFKPFLLNIENISFFEIKEKEKRDTKITKVFLYAQSDTLANSCSTLYLSLINKFETILTYPCYKDEGAETFFTERNLPSQKISYRLLKNESPDILILLNDWSKEAIRIISICRILKIPTVCLQESIIDFGDSVNRMQFADYVFVQGTQTTMNLDRNLQFITGNPRYNIPQYKPSKSKQDILINCNFTYNIFEEVRDEWLQDITTTAETLNLSFKISQHPRDKGELIQYQDKIIKSNSASVEQQIVDSNIIITRFSSLIHEGILQKKYVIYYNPHGETMEYDFRFNDTFLYLVKNKQELKESLNSIKQNLNKEFDINQWENYIISHIRSVHIESDIIIESLFEKYSFKFRASKFSDYSNLIILNPYILKLYRNFRY